jgi:TRAP-type C4-dicarboxylate transport system permease small subunit
LRKLLSNAEECLAGLLLAGVTLLITLQLLLHGLAPRWASRLTPLVLALFFWATLMAVPAATRRGGHLGLTLLSRWLPPRWRRVLQFIVLAATVAFFAALTVTGAAMCLDPVLRHNRFLGTWCPDWGVAAAIPIAAALSIVRAVEAWSEVRRGSRQAGEA